MDGIRQEMNGGRDETRLQFASLETFTNCPVCASSSPSILFTDRNRRENLPISGTYVLCRECHHTYLIQFPNRKELAQSYQQLYFNFPESCLTIPPGDRPGLLGAFLRVLRNFRRRPHSWPTESGDGRLLLDVGCGLGTKLLEYRANGWRVAGLDVSSATLRVAAQKVSDGLFLQAEAEALPFREETFDVIRIDNVLEHIPDAVGLLSRLRSLLRPGGRLYVYVPNSEALSVRLFSNFALNYWIPFHIHLFSSHSLEEALKRAGFARTLIRYHNPIYWLPDSLKQRLGGNVYTIKRSDSILRLLSLPLTLTTAFTRLGEELVAEAKV